jgi:hypothetical protein
MNALMEPPKKSDNGSAPSHQNELALGLPGMLAHKKFPGRTSLMVPEVAAVLGIDDKQCVSLINEGLLGAVEITGRGNRSSREHWRIPVECYDDYIRRRSNTTEGKR